MRSLHSVVMEVNIASYVPVERPVSFSSSIYSQDDVTLADTAPLITISRQNSSSSTTSSSSSSSTNSSSSAASSTSTASRSTTSSQATTLYSIDPVKSLGYTPFEYWKGPLPVAYYPSQFQTKKGTSRAPPQIKTSTIPKGLVNSRRDFQPVPAARVREIKVQLDALPAPGPLEQPQQQHHHQQPPPSPRVKDRYRQREAERARRRAARRAQRARAPHEWPGWVPDEKALGRPRRSRPRPPASANRFSIASTVLLAPRPEKWSDPRTWQRRAWGVVTFVVVLLIIVAIILGQLLSRNNVLSTPQQQQQQQGAQSIITRRVLHQAAETVGAAAVRGVSTPLAELEVAAPVRRMVARRFHG